MAGLAHEEITTLPVPLKKKFILKPKAKPVEPAKPSESEAAT